MSSKDFCLGSRDVVLGKLADGRKQRGAQGVIKIPGLKFLLRLRQPLAYILGERSPQRGLPEREAFTRRLNGGGALEHGRHSILGLSAGARSVLRNAAPLKRRPADRL